MSQIFLIPHAYSAPQLVVTALEFPYDHWYRKTRISVLSRSVVCVITALAILIEHQLVTDTDTQTDRYRAIAYSPLAYRRAVKKGN